MTHNSLEQKQRFIVELEKCNWEFPPVEKTDSSGFLAVGADLELPTLLKAYSSGIFPWTDNPITWWSPDPRTIFEMDRFHVPKRIERILRSGKFQIKFDTCFERVMEECARPAPGREKTWISKKFIEAFTRLFQNGFAHSSECFLSGELVGGIYGVGIGGFFGGESMFSKVPNGSRLALTAMIRYLRSRGYILFDAQVPNPHLEFLGALEIPRGEYLRRMKFAVSMDVSFWDKNG